MNTARPAVIMSLAALLVSGAPNPTTYPDAGRTVQVRVRAALEALIGEEDTDGDTRITVDDPRLNGTSRGDKRFMLRTIAGDSLEVDGVYYLSNLLTELKLGEESGSDTCSLDEERIFESPTNHLSRMIRDLYWGELTRRIDSTELRKILPDDKTATVDGFRYLYVPGGDADALRYFDVCAKHAPDLRLKVIPLPDVITPRYVRSLDGRHGLLSLALGPGRRGVPYVVPGGRFNEMYGWDSYFIALGLLADGKVDLARGMVDNFVYQIRWYGKILNANRTYYLTRSQPPFLTSMALAVYRRLPRDDAGRRWLASTLEAAIHEYRNVWTSHDHLTPTGLSRYFDTGTGPAPEVEAGHYDDIFARFAAKHGLAPAEFERAYRSGKIHDAGLDEYFVHDRAMRESGHDTSYRLEGICADLATVDLNSLLYKYESDLAGTIRDEFNGALRLTTGDVEEAADWDARAQRRRELMTRLLWNEERGMFFDYDYVRKEQTGYVSATTFYPLWAGLATSHQAQLLVRSAPPLLEMAGGLAASSRASRGELSPARKARQWDYPNGWAPHQMLAWEGLRAYGFSAMSRRLAYRWLYAITINAVNYNGTVTEKLDVVRRSHDVFAEYGNVGTAFSYITREGFGWTNASYEVGLGYLAAGERDRLDALIPPEWIEFRKED